MHPNLFERYFVDIEGRMFDTKNDNKPVSYYVSSETGYKMCRIFDSDDIRITRKVVHMVAFVYLPNPEDLRSLWVVDKTKTCLDGLEWVSTKELNRRRKQIKETINEEAERKSLNLAAKMPWK